MLTIKPPNLRQIRTNQGCLFGSYEFESVAVEDGAVASGVVGVSVGRGIQ